VNIRKMARSSRVKLWCKFLRMTPLTIDVPEDIMRQLQEIASTELRTPESQALWFLREALNRKPRKKQQTLTARLVPYQPIFDELKRLCLLQGNPSCRMIAEAVRRRDKGYTISHSTVNTVITGTSVPAWAPLEKITVALNGNPGAMKQLWLAATAGDSVTQ
jgi:hypothetical protein